jgi:large subunit ribosomal protein L4
MQVPVQNLSGVQVSTVELPPEIFEAAINTGLMWQYYTMQRDNARQGNAKVKTRSEINRTHAKWYRQKGTGRARHGSRNAPIFVGGGRSHGPLPHKYTKDMPKKMRHAALRSALSAALRDGQIVVVNDLVIENAKTKVVANILKNLVGDEKVLVVVPERLPEIERCIRNIPRSTYLRADYVNVRDLLQYPKIIIPLASLEIIKTILGKDAPAPVALAE